MLRMRMTNTTASGIAIRPASGDDLPAVVDLLTKTNLPVEGVKESIGSFVVAENGGRVVGVGGVERCGNYGLLRSVAVDAAMIERLIADSRASGLRALYLLTTTAENYFPSFGFDKATRDSVPAEIQQTAEFKDLCPSSAIVMWRALSGETTQSH
jgi:amino-acid N-acetyltransferase